MFEQFKTWIIHPSIPIKDRRDCWSTRKPKFYYPLLNYFIWFYLLVISQSFSFSCILISHNVSLLRHSIELWFSCEIFFCDIISHCWLLFLFSVMLIIKPFLMIDLLFWLNSFSNCYTSFSNYYAKCYILNFDVISYCYTTFIVIFLILLNCI